MSRYENERDAIVQEVAAELPESREGLLKAAKKAVSDLNAAVMQNNVIAAGLADEKYQAVIWKLNGGSFFGSMANDGSAGRVVEDFCRAGVSEVPGWGQSGEFFIEVDEVQARVAFSSLGLGRVHYGFYVVDPSKPFISETGYRSHFAGWGGGRTVSQEAERHFRTLLKDSFFPGVKPESPAVPEGFEIVDVVLPEHKAYIVKKWAAVAEARIRVIQNS